MGKFLTTNTQILIGNEGYSSFHVTKNNESLIRNSLSEFNKQLFDEYRSQCKYRYIKVYEADCILTSLEVLGQSMWAGLMFYCPAGSDRGDSALIKTLERGKLYLGCEYEFDSTIVRGIQPLAVSDQLTSVKFNMLYYYSGGLPGNRHFRRTIFKI